MRVTRRPERKAEVDTAINDVSRAVLGWPAVGGSPTQPVQQVKW